MTHAPIRSFCATTAICAVLALGSTPAWAQDASAPVSAAPPITLPAPAPAAQPTIVLPAETPAPAAPAASPVVQQVPAAAPAAAADEPAPKPSAKPRAVAKTAPPTLARSVSTARTVAPETAPVTPVAAPAPSAADAIPPVAAPPLAQPAVTPPPAVAAASPAESDSSNGLTTAAWIAGILAALGIGTVGVVALRSRRRDEEEDYEEAYYEEAHAAEPARFYDEPGPMMVPPMATEPRREFEPELPMPAYAPAEMEAEPVKAIEPTPHPSVAQLIGTEELVPDTREERDVLLERMVSAEPDAENPFTSRKGRMRRARLILQAREHEQKEAEAQPFDWRTYQTSTSNPAPATPPRVTV